MSAVQFPTDPSLGEFFTSPDGIIYRWDGEKWSTQLGPSESGATGATGPAGPGGGATGATGEGATGATGVGSTGATGPALDISSLPDLPS